MKQNYQQDNSVKARYTTNGVVMLPIVLLIGGVIIEIGIAGAFITLYSGQVTFGIKTASEALAAAHSGVEDGMIKIVRDKNTSLASTTVLFGETSAEVSILKDFAGGFPAPGKDTITAIGSAGVGSMKKKRKLQSVVNVNQGTGEMRIEWLREIPL